ncbi:unnamed protein product [Caenorhabditis brenneri]
MPSLRSNAGQGRRTAPTRNNETKKPDKRNFNKAQREILEEFFQRKKFTFTQKDLKQLMEQCKEVDNNRQFVTIEKIKGWFKEKRKEVKQNAPEGEEREEEIEEAIEEDPEVDPAAEAAPASALTKSPAAIPASISEVASTANSDVAQEGTSSMGAQRESTTDTLTASLSTVTEEPLEFTAAQRRCLERFFKTKQSDLTMDELKQLEKRCLAVDSSREYATVERIQAWFRERNKNVRKSISIHKLPPYKPFVFERRVEVPAVRQEDMSLNNVVKEDPMTALLASRVANPLVPQDDVGQVGQDPVAPEASDELSGVIKEDPMAALQAARVGNPLAPLREGRQDPVVPEASDELRGVIKEDPMAGDQAARAAKNRPEVPEVEDPIDANSVAPEVDPVIPDDLDVRDPLADAMDLDPEALLEQELLQDPEAELDPGALLDPEALLEQDPLLDPEAPVDAMEEDPVMDQVNEIQEAHRILRDETPEEEAPEEETPETVELSVEEDSEDPQNVRNKSPAASLQDANEDLELDPRAPRDQDLLLNEDQDADAPMDEDPDALLQDAMDEDQADQEVDLDAAIMEDPEDHEDPVVFQDEMELDHEEILGHRGHTSQALRKTVPKFLNFSEDEDSDDLQILVDDDLEILEAPTYTYPKARREKPPPAPKKPRAEMRNVGAQAKCDVPAPRKPSLICKRREDIKVDYKLESYLKSLDFDDVIKKRVGAHGEGFRKIPLPFSNSLDYYSWSEKETFQFFCQFVPCHILSVIKTFNLRGSTLGSFWTHDSFKKMNESCLLLSYEEFCRIGIKMRAMWEAVDQRQSCFYNESELIEASEEQPELHFPLSVLSGDYFGLTKNDKQTQTKGQLAIEAYPDSISPDDDYVTVGLKTTSVRKLQSENERKYGDDYFDIHLPFNGEIDMEEWTRGQVVEFCCQFLPARAVRGIWDHRITGYVLPHLIEEERFFSALNMKKVVICHEDFLELEKEVKKVRAAYWNQVEQEI